MGSSGTYLTKSIGVCRKAFHSMRNLFLKSFENREGRSFDSGFSRVSGRRPKSEGISFLFSLDICDCKLRWDLICCPTCRLISLLDFVEVEEKVLHCCFDSASVVRRSELGKICLPVIFVQAW